MGPLCVSAEGEVDLDYHRRSVEVNVSEVVYCRNRVTPFAVYATPVNTLIVDAEPIRLGG
jgi:hypothetical protein